MAGERHRSRKPLLFQYSRAAPGPQRFSGLTAPTPRRTRVLIVEDNVLVTDALRTLFEESGYAVDVAASIAEATAVMAERKPDVVFLDVVLPDGDGLTLVQKDDNTPVYAVTGHGDEETWRRCMAAGCRDVLLKPVPVSELLRRARVAVSSR